MKSRSKARHNHRNEARIHGRASPGLCVKCGKLAPHLYPKNDGTGLHYCYPCRKDLGE